MADTRRATKPSPIRYLPRRGITNSRNMGADLMQTYSSPSGEGLVADKEYGIEFHVRLTNEAFVMATEKDWKPGLQIAFPRLEITYCAAIPETVPWMVFEVCFRAPYASPDEPIRFDTVGRIIADHITETLDCGNLDTVQASWISARTGTPKEISNFFYKGYEGAQIGADDLPSIGERLAGIWGETEKVGKFALIAVCAILAMKVVDVVKE